MFPYTFVFLFLSLSYIEGIITPGNVIGINNIIDIPNKISVIPGFGSKGNDTSGDGTTTVMGTNYGSMIPNFAQNMFGMNKTGTNNDTGNGSGSNGGGNFGSIISGIPNKIFPNKTGGNSGIPGYGYLSNIPNNIFGNNITSSDNGSDSNSGSGLPNFGSIISGFPDKIFGNNKTNSANGTDSSSWPDFSSVIPGIFGNKDKTDSGSGNETTSGTDSGNTTESGNGTTNETGSSSSSGFPDLSSYIPGLSNKKNKTCGTSPLSQYGGIPDYHGYIPTFPDIFDRPPPDCVVSGAFALLLRISSGAGVCPLRFTRAHNGWLLTVSSPLAAVQRVVMTVINVVMLTAVIMDFCMEPEKRIRVGATTLKTFVWISDMALMMVIASVAVYMGPSRMKSVMQVQNELLQVSIDLKMKEPARSEKFRSIGILGIMIWAILIITADFYSYMELSIIEGKMWSIMCMYISYYIGNFMEVLVVLQWACAALAVHASATALNDELYRLRHANLQLEPSATLEDLLWPPKSDRNILVDCFTRPRKVNPGAESFITPLQAQATIRRLALSHERISELTRQMNSTNGTFLMVVLMSTFLRLVLTPYYLLLRLEYNERVVTETLLQLNWSIFLILVLLMTIEPCHWTQEQTERTQVLLSQLIVHLAPKCERLSKELDQFAKQILLSNAKFMPLGVYHLARPLMATVWEDIQYYTAQLRI